MEPHSADATEGGEAMDGGVAVVQQLVSNYSILAEQGRDASSDER